MFQEEDIFFETVSCPNCGQLCTLTGPNRYMVVNGERIYVVKWEQEVKSFGHIAHWIPTECRKNGEAWCYITPPNKTKDRWWIRLAKWIIDYRQPSTLSDRYDVAYAKAVKGIK